MMKNIKVDNHQFISRLIYANNALFLQKWDAPFVFGFSLNQISTGSLVIQSTTAPIFPANCPLGTTSATFQFFKQSFES